ncbi:MAG TPA: LuxR C-terminal-related transcriptional regulator [Bacillales bacterium]|nr:LuxR C-terminal-related transcriptional regulator [Bacillales bacterium]
MVLTLDQHMKVILQNGLNIVFRHREAVHAEWRLIAAHLREHKEKTAAELDIAIDFFSEYLFSESSKDSQTFLNEIQAGIQRFEKPFHPNHVIFTITLLENAVHKAIKSDADDNYSNHQAVQFLFSQISEQILTYPFHDHLDLDLFLDQLASSQQLPIEWIAKAKRTKNGYEINEIADGSRRRPSFHDGVLHAESMFLLSETLLNYLPAQSDTERKVSTLPWKNETLLICTNEGESAHTLSFIAFTLQILSAGESTLRYSKQKQQWKDAVILFNEWIMRSQNLNEVIQNITFGFVNYLPFERCALFSYSTDEGRGFGLSGYHFNNEAIRSIKEPIDNIPLIKKNLRNLQPIRENLKNLQPIYISEATEGFPTRYVREFQLETVVVAPIYVPSEGRLIGAAILDQGPGKKFKLSRETFTALMKFGQSAGEILAKFGGGQPEKRESPFHLSPREVEVLKLMADGASTMEAAGELQLSEYTVRDYVSTVMHKMNARNRTEAAARAIRSGII